MKISHVVLLFAVIVLSIGSSLAQPASKDVGAGKKKEQGAASNQTAPKPSAPSADKPVAPEQQSPDYRAEANDINRGIREYTGWLVIATALLALIALFQFWQMFWGQRRVERAYGFGGPSEKRKEKRGGLYIRIQFINYGRTPAFLKEVEWGVSPIGTLPAVPTYPNRMLNHMIVRPQMGENTEAGYLALPDWKEPHALYARFTYEDIFGKTHKSGLLTQVKVSRDPEKGLVASHPPIGGHPEYVKWN
jgi:hypothetical protein